uniref:AlNc14C76G5092 protein n=1 Tax=Albugo laibachii Nc14 TaxID=890382 RepID=F0WEP2_9STRA|nr:AlNc14C76G5092 [Albugo laibachii Nc14]|eukprot:CCA19674.1 AlNc14C76G5092 [Albugo laibachii Nc14]
MDYRVFRVFREHLLLLLSVNSELFQSLKRFITCALGLPYDYATKMEASHRTLSSQLGNEVQATATISMAFMWHSLARNTMKNADHMATNTVEQMLFRGASIV